MFYRSLLAALAGLTLTGMLQAATVRSLSVDEIASKSSSIFEGRVIGIRVVQGNSSRDIRTLVTFEVMDALKGDLPTTLELSFMGGAIGGRELRVSDQHIPSYGERGVYFVESIGGRQANPLYGWTQGHFLVGRDSRVTTVSGKPIFGLESQAMKRSSAISGGIARGVRTEPAMIGLRSMDVSEFKASVREMLK